MLVRSRWSLKNQKHGHLLSCYFVPGTFIYTISQQPWGAEMISIEHIKQARFRGIICLLGYLILTKTLRTVRTTSIFQMRKLSFRKTDWLVQGHSPSKWQARIWTCPHLMPNQFWCSELQWSGNRLLHINIFIFYLFWIWLREGLANSVGITRDFSD